MKKNFNKYNTMTPTSLSLIEISLLGAFVADVVSLALRTPADAYAVRLQVARAMPNATRVDLGDSLRDGAERFVPVVITDLPYLLTQLAGNIAVTRGNEGLAQCEVETIAVACLCAAFTTPFDVARTRIFIHENTQDKPTKTNGVLTTMTHIVTENQAGLQNLYAGWIERTAYFGAGRAWTILFELLPTLPYEMPFC